MRCLLCDAEMILMNVVQDDTMLVAGFEHRTFMCSSCHDVERRLVFVGAAEAIPVPATPSIAGEQSDSGPVPPPESWRCPDCGTEKATFRPHVESAITT
jgi:hypothetical protein